MTLVQEYEQKIAKITQEVSVGSICAEVKAELQGILDRTDYIEALKVINNKGLLAYTMLPNKFGWKCQYYIDYVLRLLNSSRDDTEELKAAFKEYISLVRK